MNKNQTFWLFTIVIFLGLLLPSLVQKNMFLDGVTYASISKNLANGIGTLWCPQYTKTVSPKFFGHPPLVFIIQSLFFKILGNGIYTERIFSFVTAIISALGIIKLWKLFNINAEKENISWLPVLLWITVPIVFWSYSNNLLENTVSIFTLFAVYFISKSFIGTKKYFKYIGIFFIFLGFLSKGLVALFPLILPLLFAITYGFKKYKFMPFHILFYTLILLFFFFISFLIFPDLKTNLTEYLHLQISPIFSGNEDITTNNRFSILLNLLLNLSLPILILFFFSFKEWKDKKSLNFLKNEKAIFFFLIGLSASLPMIITLKQRNFYLSPSIPFYALAISFWIQPFIKKIAENLSIKKLKIFQIVSFVLLGIAIIFTFSRYGKYSLNEAMIKDVYTISETIPKVTIIYTTSELWNNWKLEAYLYRIAEISLSADKEQEYFLIEKNKSIPKKIQDKYKKTDIKLNKYQLFEKN